MFTHPLRLAATVLSLAILAAAATASAADFQPRTAPGRLDRKSVV